MSRKYYLVDKEIIDSRIEELQQKYNEITNKPIKYKLDGCLYDHYFKSINVLKSLTQQSELVEVKEIVDVVKAEYVKNDTKGSFLKWLEEVKSYKIIKNIK
jgi:flagellar biosynthesis chaperone FliJ